MGRRSSSAALKGLENVQILAHELEITRCPCGSPGRIEPEWQHGWNGRDGQFGTVATMTFTSIPRNRVGSWWRATEPCRSALPERSRGSPDGSIEKRNHGNGTI